jgi:hypothetical protein
MKAWIDQQNRAMVEVHIANHVKSNQLSNWRLHPHLRTNAIGQQLGMLDELGASKTLHEALSSACPCAASACSTCSRLWLR